MRGYVRTQYGDYIIPIGNKYNLLVYTDDNIESPHIRKVLEINSEDQILLDSIRRDIQDANSEKLQMADDYVRRIYGPENFVEYKRQNFTSFRGYIKSQQERMVSGTSSNVSAAGVDGPDSIRQNSQTERADLKRSALSLSEQGKSPIEYGNLNIYGEDVKLEKSTETVEDIAPVMDNIEGESQIYNWGVKKDTSLDGVRDDSLNRKPHDVSSDVSIHSISNIAPIVNKQDISAIETAEEISKIDSDIKLEGQPKTRKQLHNKIIDNIKSVFSGKGFDFDTKVHNSCMQKRAESFLSALQIILHSRLHGFHG